MLHGIAKLRASRFWIVFRGHLLKHSFLPEVMNECPFLQAEVAANNCEILPHWSMPDKLLHECFSIRPGFCEEQDPGGEPIDAMHDKGLLPLRFQFCRKNREGRWKIGVVGRDREHFGRLIEDDNGIVLVKDAKLPPVGFS